MKKNLIPFAALMLVLSPLCVRAGGDEVVVVYNTRVPESKMVADHYAQMRQVPTNQIFGFAMTTGEEISRLEFRDSLQRPLAKKLETEKLWRFGDVYVAATNGHPEQIENRVVESKIRYAVLCYGVPLKIAPDPDLQEPVDPSIPSEMRRNEAAVDSELALLPAINMRPRLTGPLPNWIYGQTNHALMNPTNGILIVTRLDGPTAQIANTLVDKSMQAEATGLWGRAYFDARGLDKTNLLYAGDGWILGGAELCREIGFETVVDDKPDTFPADFPMSQIAIYCGWYDENASGPFAQPKVEFMNGAFAYHLHSASANSIRTANRFWVGPLLAKGVTCTMGAVYEPYLGATPNVALFLARFIANGMTFGEAALIAQPALSWQTTIVGDPLYQPFGKEPAQLHANLVRSNNPLIEWSHLRIVNTAVVRGAPPAQVEAYLENIPARTNSAVLTEKLADVYAAIGKPLSAIEMYQRAMSLNPSPEQKIRLRLILGKKMQEQNQTAGAIEDYKTLLAEVPDYPGKNSVLERISALEEIKPGTNAPAKP